MTITPSTPAGTLELLPAEQAIHESAAQFRLLAQAMPNHVWTATPDGNLTWFNDQVYEYSGADAGGFDGYGWVAIVHGSNHMVAWFVVADSCPF